MVGRLVDRCVGAARPEIIGARVACDPEEPGFKPAFVTPRRAVFQHPHEHVLHEVLRSGRIAGHPREKLEERAMVPLEQDSELGDVASAHGVHECLVGHRSVVW